ncbi:MAG: glycosyltransferase family 9 protein [Vibrio fluvialis]
MPSLNNVISKLLNIRKNKFNSIHQLPNNPNIIIDATFNIGDYLAISPVIEALKSQWNKPNILVLCTSKNVDVVKTDKRIKYLLLPNKDKWHRYPSILRKNITSKYHVDLLVEPAAPDLPHRSIIGYTLQPDLTIGNDYEKFRCVQPPKKKLDNYNISQPQLYSDLMQGYGFKATEGKFNVFEELNNTLKIERELEARSIGKYIAFNPFASTKNRSLTIEKSKDILLHLTHCGLRCIFPLPFYIENKEEWTSKLAPLCDVFVVNTIHDSIGLIKNSVGIITVDTALVHIASVYDVPTIGLYREKVINCKNWHPQSSKNHICLLTAPVEEIVKPEIFS